ncbi:hypothetical protein BGZ83_001766 [Gryganskiella cystojenkinii]|nr:hypothetical protein BGZ83_001766 [Gryganskiella cystojenkinii]
MSTLLSQAPITLCNNPFSILECSTSRLSNSNGSIATTEPRSDKTAINDDEDLDLSSWSVVNSAYNSEDEDNEDEGQDHDEDEIYDGRTTDLTEQEQAHQHQPLTLSNVKDGFTNISKAKTAHSTNSAASASAPGTWVLKVNKKKRPQQPSPSPLPAFTTSSQATPSTQTSQATQTTHEKRSVAAIQTASDEENEEDGYDDGAHLYMSMTEHELAKSTSASKIKNTRVAKHHGRELARALKCLDKETEKIDKKAIKMRAGAGSKSKTNNAKGRSSLKSKVQDGDY